MLRSLFLYTKNFSSLLFQKELGIVLHDLKRYNNKFFSDQVPGVEREQALDQAMEWLLSAGEHMADSGIGSYHLVDGWSSSYPETSGYIIPTLIVYGGLSGKDRYIDKAMATADWLVSIQKTSGGWQGGRINEDKPEIVFNTGQVIRGMLASFAQDKSEKYLDAAIRAGDWLLSVQHEEGFWKKHALMESERVYDSYVDVPLLMLADTTGKSKYKEAALRNLDWIISKKQHENGWFEDCDNTIKHNDRPILHTIAYTIDGLIDAGIRLNSEKFKDAAIRPSQKLRDLFLENGTLKGRYDSGWNGSEYMILTGCAQMSIVWMKIFILTKDPLYLKAAQKMIDLLVRIQNREGKDSNNTIGAIQGSFPVWGKYEPFAYPNWATKYFADALILEQNIHQH